MKPEKWKIAKVGARPMYGGRPPKCLLVTKKEENLRSLVHLQAKAQYSYVREKMPSGN